MAGRIPQSFIDDLLSRIDIVDVVDCRTKLKKTGKNYSACCPFHDEKTPSFTVSPDKQFYYCFGCGASGNAIGFAMEFDRLTFPEAVEDLAKLAGIEVPKEDIKEDPKAKVRATIYKLLEQSDHYYRQQLRFHPRAPQAIDYLKGRGLSGEIARDYNIGYAPPGWDNLLKAVGLSEDDKALLTEGGMLIQKEGEYRLYDRFRQRIMFPIRDIRGRVIGFGGRVLTDEKPKYLNSPETPVFQKGRELYGLWEARQHNRQIDKLLVVEGYMDVVALAQFNIRNAVATLGTACGEDHLRLAFKYTNEVVFCFDGDAAGRKAASRALENSLSSMSDGRQIRFMFLPDGEDPDTLVRQIGTEKFLDMVSQATPLEQQLFDSVSEDIDVRTMEGRARLSKFAAPMLHKLPQGIYRELMFDNLAKRTGLDRDTLRELAEVPLEQQDKARLERQQQEHQQQQARLEQEQLKSSAPSGDNAPQNPTTPNNDNGQHSQNLNDHAPIDDYGQNEYIQASGIEHYSDADHYALDAPDGTAEHYIDGHSHLPAKLSTHQLRLKQLARHLITLLLNHTELAQQECTRIIEDDNIAELQTLRQLLALLQTRPEFKLNNIVGHWQAIHDSEAYELIAELAGQCLMSEGRRFSEVNHTQEYLDTWQQLIACVNHETHRLELLELQAKPLPELTTEERQRLISLITQQKVK